MGTTIQFQADREDIPEFQSVSECLNLSAGVVHCSGIIHTIFCYK